MRAFIARYIFARLMGQSASLLLLEQHSSRQWQISQGNDDTPSFVMVIESPNTLWNILLNPDPNLGEAYMENQWHLTDGDLGQFITCLSIGRDRLFASTLGSIIKKFMDQRPPIYQNDIDDCYQQVQHHYDIGNDLYQCFLDPQMNYSCAFFASPEQSLADAQQNKIQTSIDRLDIQAGMKVLDIGCGWGAISRAIAQTTQASVYGVTLAENQLSLAKKLGKDLDHKPHYILQDYREHADSSPDCYDRIISIGMVEHVGRENYDQYFQSIYKQLKPGGKALVHSIARSGILSKTNLSSPWLDKYIFPGGAIAEVEELAEAGRKQRLALSHDPFIQPSFHYAETLRRWRKNFLENYEQLDQSVYDERFKRMWIYYLCMCEAMFDGVGFRVTQIVFQKPESVS